MPRKKSKRGGVVLGFALTVGTLSLLVLILVETNPGITMVQMPDQVPSYSGLFQRYVPSDALQVSFDNLTVIRSINQTVISRQPLFELDTPHVSIGTEAVGSRLTVGLSTPNASVTIVTMDAGSFSNLTAALTGAGNTIPTESVGNLTVYAAAGTLAGEIQAYWLTLIPGDRALVYSPGANDAFQAIGHIINVYRGAPSILTRTDVNRMLYTVNGTQGHLALGIQNFAGTVRTGNATLISVDANHDYASISYVVKFADANQASAQVGAVKAAYISAHEFFRYGELVKAVETQPLSQLKVAIGLVG